MEAHWWVVPGFYVFLTLAGLSIQTLSSLTAVVGPHTQGSRPLPSQEASLGPPVIIQIFLNDPQITLLTATPTFRTLQLLRLPKSQMPSVLAAEYWILKLSSTTCRLIRFKGWVHQSWKRLLAGQSGAALRVAKRTREGVDVKVRGTGMGGRQYVYLRRILIFQRGKDFRWRSIGYKPLAFSYNSPSKIPIIHP